MKSLLTMILLVLAAGAAPAQMKDYQGYKDPALFTRMPHYFLSDEGSFVDKPFDSYELLTANGTQRVEGHHLLYTYSYDESAGNMPSMLQVVRNYGAAAKRIGGVVLMEDTRRTAIRIAKGGSMTWAFLEAFNEGKVYELHIIEQQQMQQDVVADAAALRAGLKESGHVVVPGIFFDFGKAEVKPESDKALEEMAKMLKQDAALKVWVVGHTDSVGPADRNQALSAARAAAVVKALALKGIDAKRLAAQGVGPYAPVATNDTDGGRAQNRRVELVKQ